MYCSKCGAQIPDTAKFCAKCGAPASQKQNTTGANTPNPQPTAPVQTVVENQVQAAVSPVEKKKSKAGWYVGIGCLVILLAIIGLSVWGIIYVKNKVQEEIENNPNFNLNQASLNSTGNTGAAKQAVSNNDPKIVVSSYMQNTLGSIPNAKVDYESAKKYLSSGLKKQFKTPAFVPQSYCIQDGPDNVKIDSSKINGDEAVVKISGSYGGTWTKMWDFKLKKDSKNNWEITKIKCLSVN